MYIKTERYCREIEGVIQSSSWEFLKNSKILIVGASGLIGTYMVDLLMAINDKKNIEVSVYALCRNRQKAQERFKGYFNSNRFNVIFCDINNSDELYDIDITFDYVIHGASNTHPDLYRSRPIETIMSNVNGTYNLLNKIHIAEHGRFMFCSSVEIYGESLSDSDVFDEKYCGYIDCNSLRAGYPESKRTGEALCQAFIEEKGLDIVIVRLSRVYGSTMQWEDSRAISQFIKNAVKKDDIILKSSGSQTYSYTYIADAVTAMMFILSKGKSGEEYNISSKDSDVSLLELTQILSDQNNIRVVREEAEINEAKGYSKATRAVFDISKIEGLGWHSKYSIENGLKNTVYDMRATLL